MTDWPLLFHPNPEWNQLAGQIQVYLAADGFYRITPDDQLKAIAADVANHHLALGLETGSLAPHPGETCARGEGSVSPTGYPTLASKLTRLGIRLQFLQMDGALWFGHYAGCKLPVPELASRVAETIQPLLQAMPDLQVGDVEGLQSLAQSPDWQQNYLLLKHDLEAAIGRKLMFLTADVHWRDPDWPTVLLTAAHLAHASGQKFNVIYNSDDEVPNGETWVAEAKRHFDQLETQYALIPDRAVFQSWNRFPDHVFPETSPSAHSYLVAQYRLPRTHLTAQRTATGVQGRLTELSGPAVSGARITVEVLGDTPNTPPPVRTLTGTAPPQARFAVLGMRVNSECFCSGVNDLLFGPLTYREIAGGSAHYEYHYVTPRRSEAGLAVAPMADATEQLLHLTVGPTRNFGFNSDVFPVTPGAKYQLQVPLASLTGNGLFGSATVIWMDAQRQPFKRDNITVGNDAAPVATAVTDASGNYAAALPPAALGRRPLQVYYAGSPTLRAAYAAPP